MGHVGDDGHASTGELVHARQVVHAGGEREPAGDQACRVELPARHHRQHPRVRVTLGCAFTPELQERASHVFYTGPIDRYFGFASGRLSYRSIYFETLHSDGDFQGNAVINYPELNVPYTRIHEHKHFANWERHERSTILVEHSKETGPDDVPYYPKRLEGDISLLAILRQRAEGLRGISFLGRLGTYRYLNMDQVIGEALDFAAETLSALASGEHTPTFPASCRVRITS